jgi:predicted PurR-regulated permease PerM
VSHGELKNSKYALPIVLLGLFSIAGTFAFLVYQSYFWSGIISLILYIGSRDYFLKLKNFIPERIRGVAPTLMILIVLITIVLPCFFVIRTLLDELISLLFVLKVNLSEDRIVPTLMSINLITDYFTDIFWVQFPNMYREIVSSYGDILNIDSLYGILSNTTSLILGGIKIPLAIFVNICFSFMLLFFFYKDGHKLELFLMNNLPFSEEVEKQIGMRISEAVKAVLKGNILISLLQGFVAGMLLFFAGIPNPILYGSIASFFSLIPVIGTAVVWLPAGFYIGFFEESWIVAIIYMSLSFTSYMVLENLVKPNILDKKLNLHPFLLFLALLGGIQQFGIVGLVIGPIAVTLLVILWDFWMAYRRKEFKS